MSQGDSMNIAIKISFKGSNYSGWQLQNNVPTIQGEMQKAVKKIFCKEYTVHGCSRTDAGVHAIEYVCAVKDVPFFPVEKLPIALNTYLPNDISVLDAVSVNDDFHPRFSATGKEYIYKVFNSRIRDPFSIDNSYMYKKPLDENECQKYASMCVGKFDFASFMASGSTVTDTVRTVYSFDVWREGKFVYFKIHGDGFLYNMVRIMVGTVINAYEGKIKIPVKDVIFSKNRTLAGQTMPPHGLHLNKVFYCNDFFER